MIAPVYKGHAGNRAMFIFKNDGQQDQGKIMTELGKTNIDVKKKSLAVQKLENQVQDLNRELESTKGDAAILARENIELIMLCEKHVPKFNAKGLFTSQWRADVDDDDEINIEEVEKKLID
jgi:hypothetical protein